MTTPAGTIGYNDVNAEMGLTPRVISSTYRYVNLLERNNDKEVAWSRLRNQSRVWQINDDTSATGISRTSHQSTIRNVSTYFPNVLKGDSFVLIATFTCNWGNDAVDTFNQFKYGDVAMSNRYVIGSKATYECRAVYDGGDLFYATGWQSGATKSKVFAITSACIRLIYLPAISI
jgi:hypothetical protein